MTNQRREQHPRDQHEFGTQSLAEITDNFIHIIDFSMLDLHFSNQMNINCYLHWQQ